MLLLSQQNVKLGIGKSKQKTGKNLHIAVFLYSNSFRLSPQYPDHLKLPICSEVCGKPYNPNYWDDRA